jgi:hypothetical protein
MTEDDRSALRARTLHRLDILSRQFDRMLPADLRRIALSADTPERARLRSRAQSRAIGAGLGGILDDARARFRDRIVEIYNLGGYDPTAIGLNWGRSNGTATDRVETFLAVEDAVLATVAQELIPADDRWILSEPYDVLVSMKPGPRPRLYPSDPDPE